MTTKLTTDAKNRAGRTLYVGLVIDVSVAVIMTVALAFSAASAWSDLQWALLGFSVAKSVVQAGAAFVMRRFADGASWLPTPLPPTEKQKVEGAF